MMKTENHKIVFVRLGILIICNLIIAVSLYYSYQFDNIFTWFIYATFGVITLFQLISLIKLKNKIAIGFSLVSVISIFTIYGYFEYKINKKSFLKANMHGAYIELKNDKTYIVKSGSWASKKHYYGKYEMNVQDSIIILDTNINDGTINSRRMKVTKFKNYITNDNKYHKFLIQLDQNNNEIKNKHNEIWEFYRFKIE